jgi:hypothetical protein
VLWKRGFKSLNITFQEKKKKLRDIYAGVYFTQYFIMSVNEVLCFSDITWFVFTLSNTMDTYGLQSHSNLATSDYVLILVLILVCHL